MKKFIISPDSFKGSMSSIEICGIIKTKIKEFYPHSEVVEIPIADGGEGTSDCFIQLLGAEKVCIEATGPYNEKLIGYYARTGDTAVLETAMFAGLTLAEGRLNPASTTTFGVGTMIRHAVENGCREIIIGLGGSCTNDAGTGMASALGVRFKNKEGEEFIPTGATLGEIAHIDTILADRFLKDCKITAMCDIDNPMYGKTGAAYVYAPQKGADGEMVLLLDKNLMELADTIKSQLGVDVSEIPGSGAAGAMGAGIVAFLNGSLKPGIETILDLIGFDDKVKDADIIFTGEGKIDGQSLRGKVVIGVAARAAKKDVPVVAIVGDVGDGAEAVYDMGVTAIVSINRVALPFEKAKARSKKDLADTMDMILRLMKNRVI
ncbi:glycerate kinase [Ruminiclostridium cellulolyticum]|uniref:Glycerate kinase n=1 Tax=Ruminiclostridium cellulolyticum (strain ATCC 35319 / DSM 5812 / JCM 6584 / H10) TaxID=394503 RepID=B8I6U7_RUMCH|nr:glycerate kinase [Ruminiclostridium cellulolyticum]ACL76939.1 glycerate kinase [Ruminiclostridium cellulolyticum H10]